MQIPILSTALKTSLDFLGTKGASAQDITRTSLKDIATTTMGNLTRLTAFLAAVVPSALVAADGPADLPKISSITYSGNGCIKDPKYSGNLNDPTFSYSNFAASYPGSNRTLNCEVHINLVGGSPGWQFALTNNLVKGHVVLPAGACLDYYTQVFFSQNAAKTVSFTTRTKTLQGYID